MKAQDQIPTDNNSGKTASDLWGQHQKNVNEGPSLQLAHLLLLSSAGSPTPGPSPSKRSLRPSNHVSPAKLRTAAVPHLTPH